MDFFSTFIVEIDESLIKRIHNFLFQDGMIYRAEIWYTYKVTLSLY